MIALPVAAGLTAVAASAMNTPQPAPPLAFRLADGKTIDLASYKGKVVALEFLLTTCPHCQRCSAIMQKLYQEFGEKQVQMLGVAVNDMAHMLIAEYSQKLNLTYPVGYGSREMSHNFLQHPFMKTMYMPQLVIIDRKGVIRFHHPGEDQSFYANEEANMRKEIAQLLNEGAPAARPGSKKAPAKKAAKQS
ncbi:MAG: TlpA family protein disulfide reductase [Bryobacterales bacterium]|nr:TlpA family protein disulfide reductase [Bryobacterales bacterium]